MTERGRILIDGSGVIIDVDAVFCTTLRLPAETVIGKNMLDFTAPADRERCMLLIAKLLNDRVAVSTVKRLIRPDLSHLWIQSNLSIASSDRGDARVTMVIDEIPPPADVVKPAALLRTAKLTLEARRARGEIFCPSLFSDSAWDILLAAYISEAEGTVLTLDDLQTITGVGMVNLSRWIRALGAQGLIEYELGGEQQRMPAVFRLSCDSHQRFERYLSARYKTAVTAAVEIERLH